MRRVHRGAVLRALRGAGGAAIGAPLSDLFQGLHDAEARHYRVYLDLARRAAKRAGVDLEARIDEFAALEAELITRPTRCFAFIPGRPGVTARRQPDGVLLYSSGRFDV